MRFLIGMLGCGIYLIMGGINHATAQEIVNPCGAGRFMDAKGACYDCVTETGAPDVSFNETAQALCQTCGNRSVVGNTCRLNECEAGRHLRDKTGACRDCLAKEAFFVGNDREAQALCRACGNREVTPDGQCRLTRSACVADNGFYDEANTCVSCDYPRRVALGKNKSALDSCMACGNREVAVGGVCQIKAMACRRGQKFAGPRDACYDCSTDEAVDIGKNVMLQYACTACPNRIVTPTGQCVKAACEAGQFMDETGACRACDTATAVPVGTQARLMHMCAACPQRQVVNTQCVLREPTPPTDGLRVPFLTDEGMTFTDMGGETHACTVQGGVPVGYVTSAKESCQRCMNRFVSTTNLCLPTSCEAGFFMDAIGFCHPCNTPEGVFVGWGEHRLEQMCLACHERQVSNGYCYRG